MQQYLQFSDHLRGWNRVRRESVFFTFTDWTFTRPIKNCN